MMIDEKSQPWYRWVRRWGQTNLTEDDPARNNIDFWKNQWKRTKVQGVIVNCGGIVAYYPSKYPLQYRASTLGDGDYYKAFSDAAKECGLVVVARMDINRATPEFYQSHPDWFAMDASGQPYKSQGRYFSCVNSDYYKQYIPAVLTEIIERYQPAGFADNSWKGMGREHICYCQNCRDKFLRDKGLGLPAAPDWNDPTYREWIRWSYDCRTENWDLFNEVTQRVGGKDCLWLGMLHADPVNLSGSFGDLKALCARSKFIFSDHQSRNPLDGFEQNCLNGQLLRLASDEQVAAPESMANYVRGDRTFRLAANPKQETETWMISGIAGGISPWFHHIGGGTYDRRQFDTPVDVFSWHAANEDVLYERRQIGRVGLIWSQENADFYGRDSAKDRVALPWCGFTHALTEAHIPFLPIHIDDVDRYAGRIDTLILPDIAALSSERTEALIQFLDRGGHLVLSGLTGTMDEDGQSLPSSPLLNRLGLRHTQQSLGTFEAQPTTWEYAKSHTYLHLPSGDRHSIFEGFEKTDIIAFGGGLRNVVSEGALQPLCGMVMPFPIYPPEFSWIREIDDDTHPLFAGTLDSGSRVVYFAADIDRCYGRERLPDHAKLLANAVRWAMGGEEDVRIESDGFVQVAMYEQEGRTLIHLVNLSGCNENPGYCHRVIPLHDVLVSIPTRGEAKRATLRVLGESAPLAVVDGRCQIRLPRLGAHELIVIE